MSKTYVFSVYKIQTRMNCRTQNCMFISHSDGLAIDEIQDITISGIQDIRY